MAKVLWESKIEARKHFLDTLNGFPRYIEDLRTPNIHIRWTYFDPESGVELRGAANLTSLDHYDNAAGLAAAEVEQVIGDLIEPMDYSLASIVSNPRIYKLRSGATAQANAAWSRAYDIWGEFHSSKKRAIHNVRQCYDFCTSGRFEYAKQRIESVMDDLMNMVALSSRHYPATGRAGDVLRAVRLSHTAMEDAIKVIEKLKKTITPSNLEELKSALELRIIPFSPPFPSFGGEDAFGWQGVISFDKTRLLVVEKDEESDAAKKKPDTSRLAIVSREAYEAIRNPILKAYKDLSDVLFDP